MEGAISPQFIADSISKHSSKTTIGAHDIFLGQVRADEIDGKQVVAIDYSAYEDMAEEKFHEIREHIFSQYDITCMHIHHSKGIVKAGEICLFVFVSSAHRQTAFDACHQLVELIKKEVPVFGKELFSDDTFVWKENKI
ncbi:MAG: molybdenum cofactor biosynthesis protein MoaE [Bacteroidota bacterium]|nr:molybdenum cofactor biosynthesis protein MoaE [Bacteroidota bacterium]